MIQNTELTYKNSFYISFHMIFDLDKLVGEAEYQRDELAFCLSETGSLSSTM